MCVINNMSLAIKYYVMTRDSVVTHYNIELHSALGLSYRIHQYSSTKTSVCLEFLNSKIELSASLIIIPSTKELDRNLRKEE